MKKFKVLVVCNDMAELTFVSNLLILNGFNVSRASSRAEALNLIHREKYDLVFADSKYLDSSTENFCMEMKNAQKSISSIFIVSESGLDTIDKIFDCGASDYLVRPIHGKELVAKAKMHLEVKYSREIARNVNQILEDKVARRTIELEDSLKSLEAAKKELEQLAIAKSEFLNLISHEIRTPLNGILGSLALIGRYDFPDEVKRYFSLLDTSVKRLEKFSNTILESSTLRLKKEKALIVIDVDVVKLLRFAIDQCKAKYSSKNIDVELVGLTSNTIIRGDHKFLVKCFSAILDNAFKFSPMGGKVEVSVFKSNEQLIDIKIVDQGKGFSIGALSNLFMPLSNLDGHVDQNTGMGLHLSKLIVEAHSGSIQVGNLENSGAQVQITLPQKVVVRRQTVN